MAPKSALLLILRAIVAMTYTLLSTACEAPAQESHPTSRQAAGPSGLDVKRPAKHKEYEEILRESDIVILGEVTDTAILQLKNEPGPPPKPLKTVNEEGLPITVTPWGSSFFSSKLLDPPRLWCCRSEVRVIESFAGPLRKGDRISADLAYAVNKDLLEEYMTFSYVKEVAAKGAQAVFHLRKKEASASTPGTLVYELIPEEEPWKVKKGEEQQTIVDMRIRMRRYEALQQIDKLVAKIEDLSDTERKTLRELVTASRPGLGQPRWAPRERTYLDQVLAGSVPGQTPSQAWRSWWSAYRHTFINAPFRIGAGLGSQPSTASRPA